jgi:hypothetical protein
MQSKTNYLALIACPIANALLGMGWYGTFKMRWMFAHGLTQSEIDANVNPWLPYAASVGFALVSAFLLDWLFRRMGVSGWLDGLRTGASIGLFGLMGITVMILFSHHSLDIALIDGGFGFVLYTIYGLILGAWPKK